MKAESASERDRRRQRGASSGHGARPEPSGGVTFSIRAIGIVHTPFRKDCPPPKHFERYGGGTLEVLPEFQPALCGLTNHSHLWLLLYQGGRPFGEVVAQRPSERGGSGRVDDADPSLQNIGRLALVKLLGIEGTLLRLEGLDADDGTPVLDIMPLRTTNGPSVSERAEENRIAVKKT